MIAVSGLRCLIGRREVLRGIELAVAPGEVLGLLGENGAGKSTLLRCIGRLRRPAAGRVAVDGCDVWASPARLIARKVAILLQELPSELELTALEIVMLARLPQRSLLAGLATPADRAAAAEVLARAGAAGLAARRFDRLSGGERQRVMIARALAQATPVLLLDEPVNHLDVRHQLATLSLVRRSRRTVVAALHDLNLAAAFCDRLAVLSEGRIVAIGTPEMVLTPAVIARTFAVTAGIDRHPCHGRPRVSFGRPLAVSEERPAS